jgi:hypothetical protein
MNKFFNAVLSAALLGMAALPVIALSTANAANLF